MSTNMVKFGEKKQSLYIFPGGTINFTEICSTKRNLHTLIVIGQDNITSLDGISNLIHLRELWIVECQVKETRDLEKCKHLEKIFLYSNQIDKIPNLMNNKYLSTLNLAGNRINCLENLRGLENLREINLATNNINRIIDNFPRSGQLKNVNFSGNPLYSIKDIFVLFGQKNLESIAFADSLYGECPLVHICHYRYHIINCLPGLKELDHFVISNEEKQFANVFIREKNILYNVTWHSSLTNFWSTQKMKYENYYKSISKLKSKIETAISSDEKFKSQNNEKLCHDFSKLKFQYSEVVEWEKKEIEEMEVLREQLKLKFQYSGNVDFIECKPKIMETCQSMLNDALCPSINNAGLKEVFLSRVTKIKNNGTTVRQKSTISCESSDLIFMFPVIQMENYGTRKWPFSICEHYFLSEKEIHVSSCLASVDESWLKEFSATKCNFKKYEKSLERRICLLVQFPASLLKNDDYEMCCNFHQNQEKCQKFILHNVEQVTPIFVIEYNYRFERQSIIDIDFRFKTHEELRNLTTLNLSRQNIAKLTLNLECQNLQELNLSHNQMTNFPNKQLAMMKNLKILNLSFNRLEIFDITENFVYLEKIDISWNQLTNYLSCLENFKNYCPNLHDFNSKYNPFGDILQFELRAIVTRIILPNLKILDDFNVIINKNDASSIVSKSSKFFSDNLNLLDKSFQESTKIIYQVNNENFESFQFDKFSSQQIMTMNKSTRKMEFNIVNYVDYHELSLSNNCLTQILMIPMKNLVKLNLSSNFLKNSKGLIKENLPSLQYLNLSNNQISSLLTMGRHEKLCEFYCSQNCITELGEFLNIQNWSQLKVVDFSRNELKDCLWRTFLLAHLPNIQYVNGKMIDKREIFEAKEEFSESLNKITLLTAKGLSEISNLKELTIVNCQVKKVNLPGDFLPCLESLDLRKNLISNLWGLHLLPMLKTLCLSHNKVECFNDNEFDEKLPISHYFPTLITLYLDHNGIQSLSNLNLQKCCQLKNLFLQYNQLREIDGLEELQYLQTLILDYNEINKIKMGNFHPNNNIELLFMENNRINYLGFVKNLPRLKVFLVANNKIENHQYLNELSTLRKLKELSIFGNPMCRKTRNHYKFVLQIFDNLRILDGIDISNLKNQES